MKIPSSDADCVLAAPVRDWNAEAFLTSASSAGKTDFEPDENFCQFAYRDIVRNLDGALRDIARAYADGQRPELATRLQLFGMANEALADLKAYLKDCERFLTDRQKRELGELAERLENEKSALLRHGGMENVQSLLQVLGGALQFFQVNRPRLAY